LSLAPSSQETSSLSDSCLSPVLSVDEGRSPEDQVSVENLSLKARLYAIRRELSSPYSFASPPGSSHQPSDFQSCSGLVRDASKSCVTFPESSHYKSALDSVYLQLVDDHMFSNKVYSTLSFPNKVRMK
jgi:hypothetical protein